MIVKAIELKEFDGKQYKSVTLTERIHDKDRFGLFSNHPEYEIITVGSEIANSNFYLNKKGYLALSDGKFAKPKPDVKPDVGPTTLEVKINFLVNDVKEMKEMLQKVLDSVETDPNDPF